ncbi:MAG: hypothetical protein WA702_13535 [Bradyrhizobium sp.]|jgi:hypothetical protein|uniref:hypothetical protein n=1 Tax=Bradyrhizobium sp. TaxID=376 RepID=UPI003C797D8D
MSAYRIRQLGAHVVVGTEDEAVLICTSLDVARRAVEEAECATTIPTWELLSQRAARLGEEAALAPALAADVAAMLPDEDESNRGDVD